MRRLLKFCDENDNEIETEDECEIEAILDKRQTTKETEYLVHWKDCPDEEDSWELIANLKNVKKAILDYDLQLLSGGESVRATRHTRDADEVVTTIAVTTDG